MYSRILGLMTSALILAYGTEGNRCLLSEVVQTRFALGETFGP
jgi:hypothetical protein